MLLPSDRPRRDVQAPEHPRQDEIAGLDERGRHEREGRGEEEEQGRRRAWWRGGAEDRSEGWWWIWLSSSSVGFRSSTSTSTRSRRRCGAGFTTVPAGRWRRRGEKRPYPFPVSGVETVTPQRGPAEPGAEDVDGRQGVADPPCAEDGVAEHVEHVMSVVGERKGVDYSVEPDYCESNHQGADRRASSFISPGTTNPRHSAIEVGVGLPLRWFPSPVYRVGFEQH